MSLNRIALALLASFMASAALAADPHAAHGNSAATKAEREVLYWYDPMYPQQKFDKPGKSPFMDMDLVPRYADEGGDGASVRIDPSITQNLGMRLATVERMALGGELDVVGTLQFNARDLAVVQARAEGFVERIYPHAPEDVIAAGEPLVDLLVPAWSAPQQEYLALRGLGEAELLSAARQRLRLAGLPAEMIAQLEKTGRLQSVWTVLSPLAGVIETLEVREGMTLSAGQTLARINALASVWLEVAVPEAEASTLASGQAVTARLPALPGRVLEGKIAAVLPQANQDSRTVRVRVELANPERQLRPGMTAQVRLRRDEGEALAIPSEAVIRTGRRTLVMLAEDDGRFRPLEVKLGRETRQGVEVLAGLKAGQRVVRSGQFLIDSEASLRGILAQSLEESASHGQTLHEAEASILAIEENSLLLDHGPFESLNMPGMIMGFPLADPALKQGLQVGDKVRVGVSLGDAGPTLMQIDKLSQDPHAAHNNPQVQP
ncbi:efflux RND transporter periplasmic adaptor subunit [Atopomonas hussainii]|uniref:efflux RND transporter periplasmic adaptor subunit n=1 Tax=Atopomonas hussainii TaxID=1429083 RepID=UPI0009002F1E|nr:efflux RND transporter periplasmic adaptor subunit [Atopomonas hussainii]